MKQLFKRIKGGLRFKKNRQKKTKSSAPKISRPIISTAGIKAATFVSLVVMVTGVFLWWQFIFIDEDRVFQDMIKNTLSTQSVTKVIEQDVAQQSLRQVNRLHLGGQAVVSGETTITQSGFTTARVVTEEIGTPERDYVRYTTVETSEKRDDGSEFDFSDVVGIWGVSQPQIGQGVQGEAYSEATLGVLPFANLSPTDQKRLYEFTQETQMYQIDYLGIEKFERDGRMTYSYPVLLQPEPYVAYLKQLAELQGLTQLQNVNPAQFRSVEPVRFTLEVDVLSRQPVFIEYGQDDRQEIIRDFGLLQTVDIPKDEDTVPANVLQQRLQDVR